MTRKTASGIGFMGIVIALCLWWITRGYGPVGQNAYDLATATYGACMAQDSHRLSRIRAMLEDQTFAAGLTQQEIRWMEAIISDAENGRWSSASASARQVLDAQVEYGNH